MQLTHVVETRDLAVQLGDKIVLDGVSMSVRIGQMLGVLGPNGAGKSTLFRAILGLLPSRGRVSLFGMDESYRKRMMPFIGYVPQKIDFEPLFPATVHDVVSMGIMPQRSRRRGLALLGLEGSAWEHHGSENRHNRVMKALKTVGMSDMDGHRIGELSGGQLQRVLIAHSLVKDPLLIIMDEPVSGVDVKSQALVYQAMKRAIRERHVTVIVALHDLDMLRKHTSTVLFLNNSVMYHGDTDEFFASNSHVNMYIEASMHTGEHAHGV